LCALDLPHVVIKEAVRVFLPLDALDRQNCFLKEIGDATIEVIVTKLEIFFIRNLADDRATIRFSCFGVLITYKLRNLPFSFYDVVVTIDPSKDAVSTVRHLFLFEGQSSYNHFVWNPVSRPINMIFTSKGERIV